MIKARRLGHATFETTDIERDIDYYQETIGLALAAREAKRAFLATESGQLAIVLEQGGSPGCRALSFEVAADLDSAEMGRRLGNLDIAMETRRDAVVGVPEMVAFQDPKGTRIELFQHWEFVNGNAPVSGARPNKLGHAAFIVPDPKATADFYARTLGFKIADWIEDWFVFMRCGPDHHTVNFVRGPVDRVHHIAFELRDSSHMLRACDVLGRNQINIAWGPVRHGPGHNIAVYHRNAADHLVEMFIDLDEMVDEELGYYEPRPWHRDKPQRPKVWTGQPRDIWGQPPLPDFLRDTTR